MNNKFLRNLSANSLQLLINQFFGLLIFYVLSTTLDKSSFGHVNWALAVLLTGFNILSCGIDQLSVKKVAHGDPPGQVLSIYLSHVVISGIIFYLLIVINHVFFPGFISEHLLLLLLGIGKVMIFFSTPFKQLAIGLEKFKAFLFMSVGSNVFRGICLVFLAFDHSLTLNLIILIFILGDTFEFFLSLVIISKGLKVPIVIRWHGHDYLQLIREALPQIGVVLFTSALARIDWILIGLLASASKLAEYSFAYKIFEVSTFPLLVIAPLLLPIFTRAFKHGERGNTMGRQFELLISVEMIIACFTGLLLYVVWIPVIDELTSGKYGLVNHTSVLIFSFCMPLIYINNFLWTIQFTSGHLKRILRIFAATFIINITGDLILIPSYGNEGAAMAYLAAMLIQMLLFLGYSEGANRRIIYKPLLICMCSAAIAGYGAVFLFSNTYSIIAMSTGIYIFLLMIFKQLKLENWYAVKLLLWKK